ncbi:MAG TPA: FtsX-like permease family protein [Vicinamibacterales bacterium]|nr:FtsX-like permease family protein [Vicinamibacterales bacterium]
MRSAAHALARAPGFTASVVILALALGANAALFSVANAVLWGGEDPIGKRVVIGGTVGADHTPRQIVGTVGNVRAAVESDPPLQVYVPYATNAWPTMSLAVRTSGDPGQRSASVRAAIAEVDPAQAAYDIRPFDRIASRAVATRRFQALIVAFFALAALTLAIAGVYSLVSYNVRLRTHEIGIRLALGATRHHILSLVIRESIQSSGAGIIAGLAVSFAAGRLLQGILYGVSPADPVTVLFVTLGTTPIVCVASAIAARRATRVDPVVSLRGG